MQGADYVIVAILAISVVVGGVRGLVREVVALLTWIVAIWVAWRFSGFLHPYLGGLLVTPEQKAWVARAIMLLLVLMAGAAVGAVLSWMNETAAGPGAMNRVLGVLFGFARGVVVVGFAVMLGQAVHLDREPWWEHAQLMPHAEHVANWLRGFAGESRLAARRVLALEVAPGRDDGS
jgi:membrane protein required for colicin V production